MFPPSSGICGDTRPPPPLLLLNPEGIHVPAKNSGKLRSAPKSSIRLMDILLISYKLSSVHPFYSNYQSNRNRSECVPCFDHESRWTVGQSADSVRAKLKPPPPQWFYPFFSKPPAFSFLGTCLLSFTESPRGVAHFAMPLGGSFSFHAMAFL